jgi:hypothetical protein
VTAADAESLRAVLRGLLRAIDAAQLNDAQVSLGRLVTMDGAILRPAVEAARRVEGELWLREVGRALRQGKPSMKPRITTAVWSRAAQGDPEAQALIAARYEQPKRRKAETAQ